MVSLAEQYWCHSCNSEMSITSHSSDSVIPELEPECSLCHSVFVEKLGQGVEQFLGSVPATDNNELLPEPARITVNSLEDQIAATIANINASARIIEQSRRNFPSAQWSRSTPSSSGAVPDFRVGARPVEPIFVPEIVSLGGGLISRSRPHLQGELPGSIPAGVSADSSGRVIRTVHLDHENGVRVATVPITATGTSTMADTVVREVPGDELVHSLLAAIFASGRNGNLPHQQRAAAGTRATATTMDARDAAWWELNNQGGEQQGPIPLRQPMTGVSGILQGFLGEQDPIVQIFGRGIGEGGNGGSGGSGWANLLHHILMNENSHAHSRPATAAAIAHYTREVPLRTHDELVKYCGSDSTVRRAMCDQDGSIGNSATTTSFVHGSSSSVLFSDDSILCCPITQEQFKVGDTAVLVTCCGILFQRDSLLSWLNSHDTCPICRKTFEAV